MRVMVLVKANEETEAGQLPDQRELTQMIDFNDRLVKAGVMLAGEGLHPSSRGKRVRFTGKQSTVIDGPFPNPGELVAGYWLWQVKSMEDAVEWIKQAPFEAGAEIELRPLYEAEDLGDGLTPELRAKEDRQRKEIERLKRKR